MPRPAGDVHHRVQEHLAPAVNAQGQRLHDADVGKLVHDQRRQKVALGKDQPAGVQIAERLAVVVGLLHAAVKEVAVDGLVVPREHAQGDHGGGVVVGAAQEPAARGVHVHDVPGLGARLHPVDVAAENPGVAHLDAPLARGLQVSFWHGFSSGRMQVARAARFYAPLYRVFLPLHKGVRRREGRDF